MVTLGIRYRLAHCIANCSCCASLMRLAVCNAVRKSVGPAAGRSELRDIDSENENDGLTESNLGTPTLIGSEA